MKKAPIYLSIALGSLLIGWNGCGKETTTEEVVSEPEEKKNPSPARVTHVAPAGKKNSAVPNSFWAVDRHLDQGGSFYLYLSTEQMLAKLDGYLDTASQFMDAMAAQFGEGEQQMFSMAMDMGRTAYEQSGIRDVSGFGASSFALEKDLSRTVMVVHHYADKRDGLIWKLAGGQPHEQGALKLWPTDTVLAMQGDLDVAAGFAWLQKFMTSTAPPETVAEMAKTLAEWNQQFNFQNLLNSLGGELGFMITLDAKKRVALEMPDMPEGLKLDVPEPGAAIVLKVKNDELLKMATAQLESPQAAEQVTKLVDNGVTLYTLAVPELPVKIDVSPTFMKTGDYLVLTTSLSLAKKIVAVQNGQPGLAATAEFKRLAGDIDLKGNQLHFLSSRLGTEYGKLMEEIVKAAEAEAKKEGNPEADEMLKLMKQWYIDDEDAPKPSQLAVMRVTPEGFVFESRNTGEAFGVSAGMSLVAVTGIGASMLLPALATAKQKANLVKSQNNLRQLYFALAGFVADNDGMVPAGDKWCDALNAEVNAPVVFASPLDPFTLELINEGEKASSYAMNSAVAGKKLDDLNPKTVLLFEADLGWNGTGGLQQAQEAMRFGLVPTMPVVFADGTSIQVSAEDLGTLRWTP